MQQLPGKKIKERKATRKYSIKLDKITISTMSFLFEKSYNTFGYEDVPSKPFSKIYILFNLLFSNIWYSSSKLFFNEAFRKNRKKYNFLKFIKVY